MRRNKLTGIFFFIFFSHFTGVAWAQMSLPASALVDPDEGTIEIKVRFSEPQSPTEKHRQIGFLFQYLSGTSEASGEGLKSILTSKSMKIFVYTEIIEKEKRLKSLVNPLESGGTGWFIYRVCWSEGEIRAYLNSVKAGTQSRIPALNDAPFRTARFVFSKNAVFRFGLGPLEIDCLRISSIARDRHPDQPKGISVVDDYTTLLLTFDKKGRYDNEVEFDYCADEKIPKLWRIPDGCKRIESPSGTILSLPRK